MFPPADRSGRPDFRHSRTVPPLIPTRLRLPAALLALACWVLAALLGVWYAGDHHAGPFDAAVARGVDSVVGEHSMFARVLTGPSHPVVVYPLIALTLGITVFRRWWGRTLLAVAAPGLCVLLTELLFKPLVGRVHEGVYAYPSGHTVSAVATLLVAALVIGVDWPRPWRLALFGLFLLGCVLLAVGLVGMDYHYFTDTVGGFGVALGSTLPLTLLADRFAHRTAPRGTAPPAGTPPGDTRRTGRSRGRRTTAWDGRPRSPGRSRGPRTGRPAWMCRWIDCSRPNARPPT